MSSLCKRLLAETKRNALVQYRSGYFLTALIAGFLWALLLRQWPWANREALTPVFLLLNTYLMVFSLGLRQTECELQEGMALALDASPLRPHERLVARFASLGGLALVQNVSIVAFVKTGSVSWPTLIAGLAGAGLILTLLPYPMLAFASKRLRLVARILLSLLLLVPPVLPYFGFGASQTLLLHPLYAAIMLMQGAYFPQSTSTTLLALASLSLWALGLLIVFKYALSRLRDNLLASAFPLG